MSRGLSLALLLLASGAQASSIDGAGRISIGGGLRWVPNWWLVERAAEAGTPVVDHLQLGPSGIASFGYGVAAWLELAIDLFVGWEQFSTLQPDGAKNVYSSLMGAGMVGARLVGKQLWGPVSPWLTAQGGALFSSLAGPGIDNGEVLAPAFAAGGGLDVQLSDRYGLSFDVRYVYGRNYLEGISGMNVGGVMGTLSFVIFFPPEPKRELVVPGF